MSQAIGFYFDRFRVMINNSDIARKPGNIVSLSISTDGGVSWVDGFDENHNPSGILLANKHTIFKLTENLEYNIAPVDFASIDYSASSVDIQLIAPNAQYGKNVYNGGKVLLLKSVAWSDEHTAAHYGSNTRRDLTFFVVGGANWLTSGN